MAARSKAPTYLALAAAGGVGYYLYNSGGNATAAAKQAKEDATGQPAKPTYARETGAKIDSAAHDAEKNLKEAKDATESYAKQRKDELMRGINKADQKVEEEAAKAKGWFSSGK